MHYKKQAIQELVVKLLAEGFRPFVAESGTHGFYTNEGGTRLVSFQCDFYVRFFGNYKTSNPNLTGTGWVMDESDAGDYQKMFDADPPKWAVGSAPSRLTTVAEHQDFYQVSNRYKEVVC